MTLIKICGLTRIEDAEAAIDAGVDILGFIFTTSSRQITAEKARRIISALRGRALFAGVFSQEDSEEIVQIARFCKLDLIQIHCQKREIDRKLKQFPILKLLKISNETDLQPLFSRVNFTWLLEGADKEKRIPLELLPAISGKEFFLAGGLNLDNLTDYLNAAHPLGIDVCRGVEIEPGYKSASKIIEFVRRVKLWDQKKVISDTLADGSCRKFLFNR